MLYVAAFEADPRGEVNQWWRRSSEKCDEEIVGGEPAGNPLELLLANRDANIAVSEKGKVFAFQNRRTSPGSGSSR